jgi:hypothetical protein
MTPDAQHARAGYRRPPVHQRDSVNRRDGGTTSRSAALAAGERGAANGGAPPSHASAQSPADSWPAQPKRAKEDASIVRVTPLLAVLVVTVAGVYIAWRQGSAGGGEGGVIAGLALFAGALARLLLPAGLAGLLGTRKRATDVVTLAVFGTCLLVAGLVLPR